MAPRSLRVVFCWAEVSGHNAACWRALARQPGIELHVIHPERLLERPNPFDAAALLEGISNEMFDAKRPDIDVYLAGAVAARRPDVVVLCGWIFWPYTRLVHAPALSQARIILGMDTPWRGTLAQRTAGLRLKHFIRGVDLVVTAGVRASEYAQRIGVDDARIRTGFLGCDFDRFAAHGECRAPEWPRRFLYVGRYDEEKDLPTLVRAYSMYRERATAPWTMTTCGAGPCAPLLRVAGVTDAGFTAPAALPAVFAAHGAFVLPSRFEPWGVVIAEAAASGLPVLCTTACGAAVDIVRPYYSGLLVAPRDAEALARAMHWLHDHADDLPLMGRRGQQLAAAFSADAWAARWYNYMLETLDTPPAGETPRRMPAGN